MTWQVSFTKKSSKQIKNLDKPIQSRLKKAIKEKLLVNPAAYLEPLLGDFGGYYKFRIGDYGLICSKDNHKLTIIVIELGHRREVYSK